MISSLALLVLPFAMLASGAHADVLSLLDATGVAVSVVSTAPERIVTLAPSLGEIASELLGEKAENIVGVSEYTDYPPALKKVKSVGPYHQVSIETVVSLRPNLVLATTDGNSREQVVRLRELGLRVVVVGSSSLDEVRQSMRLVGAAVGQKERAEKSVARIDAGIESLRKRFSAEKRLPRRVLVQLGDDPLIVVGRDTFLSQALEAVGFENVFSSVAGRYPRPSLEEAISKNPDAILLLTLDQDTRPFEKLAQRWASLAPQLKAVREKRVLVFPGDPLVRPTVRMLEGLDQLGRRLRAKEER